jgi:hypothetical protein
MPLPTAPSRTTLDAPRGEGAVPTPLPNMVRDKIDDGTLPRDALLKL